MTTKQTTLAETIKAAVVEILKIGNSAQKHEIEECADNAVEAAEQILEGWQTYINEWIAAGNLEGVESVSGGAK